MNNSIESGDMYKFEHLDTGVITIKLLEEFDSELQLWTFEVISAEYDNPEETSGIYWPGRTARVKETVLQSEEYQYISNGKT
jgi:hypothetical protein